MINSDLNRIASDLCQMDQAEVDQLLYTVVYHLGSIQFIDDTIDNLYSAKRNLQILEYSNINRLWDFSGGRIVPANREVPTITEVINA